MSKQCIECGADLDDGETVRSRLHDLGYLARDDRIECPDCGHPHTFGIPQDRPTTEPPECPVCQGRAYPYKVDLGLEDQVIDVHWKCEECFYFHRFPSTHLVNDVWSLGVLHLEGARDDE